MVEGSRVRAYILRPMVQGLGSMIQGSGGYILSLGSMVQGSEVRGYISRPMVWGLGSIF